jgi:beta-glucanase (GH16 family)
MMTRPSGDTGLSRSHVRLLVIFLVSALLMATLGLGASSPNNSVQAAYTWSTTPAFAEEFNGAANTGINTLNWSFDIGDGCPNLCRWGNNELQIYSNSTSNVYQDGAGNLVIKAMKTGATSYTSGKIKTQGKKEFNYAKVEARIKVPSGQGLWPAFWMLGANGAIWPNNGEIDIMEVHGRDMLKMSSALHGPGYSGANPRWHEYSYINGGRADGYHIYKAEWEATEVRFYVDGILHYTVKDTDVGTANWPFNDGKFYLILNLAVGGNFDGDPPSTATYFPAYMYVDWIHVYNQASAPATPTRTPTASSTCGATNVARGKNATSSALNGTANVAGLAVDGNGGTRWESQHGVDPGWIRVDLGTTMNLCRVKLNWEGAYGKAYQIQVSADGANWSSIYSTTTGDGGTDDLTLSGSGRYVRMYGTARATTYGYSLWEFEVYTR